MPTDSNGINKENEYDMMFKVLSSIPIGLCYVFNREFLWTNQFVLGLTEYTQNELLGSKTRRIYESDAEYERIERELESSKIGVLTRIVTKSGQRIAVMIHAISDEIPTQNGFTKPLVKTFSVVPEEITKLLQK